MTVSALAGKSEAFREGYTKHMELMKRDTTVQMARDISAARAQVMELQQSNSMKDVQLQVAQAEADRLRSAEAQYMEQIASMSNSVAKLKVHLDREQNAKEAAASRAVRSEQAVAALREAVARLREETVVERTERESTARKYLEACADIDALRRQLQSARGVEQATEHELRRERLEFLNSQSEMRQELERLRGLLQATTTEATEFKRRSVAFRVRAEEAETALANLKAVHNATIEQLVTTRDRLKQEQDARWAAETDAARLRGLTSRVS